MQPLPPTTAESLGASVRRLRLARGMTLVRLADAAGLSHPFISQVERGRARPSMASLERIARSLGSSVVELLSSGTDRPQLVESRVLPATGGVSGPYGLGTARLLGPELLTFLPMEVSGANTDPGATHVHDEDEFVIVVAGAVALDLGGAVHRLGERDSATIASRTPHRWWSPDGSAYRLLVVKESPGIALLRADVRVSTEHPEDWA